MKKKEFKVVYNLNSGAQQFMVIEAGGLEKAKERAFKTLTAKHKKDNVEIMSVTQVIDRSNLE